MRPLAGVKVLELGMVMQVPLAAQMLADYGADVIKVERPPRGDIIRDLDEVGTARDEMSCYYAAVGRGRRSICLDIKNSQGREILTRLVRECDVLIHNFRPGVMERIGFGPDQVREINPRMIFAMSTSFGAEGPLAGMPGQDMLAQSLSGFAMAGLDEGEKPRLTSVPVIDYAAAVHLTQGILAALFERERSGKGDVVSTSLFDVALSSQVLEIASRSIYSYRTSWTKYAMIFRTSDGWITVLTLFRPNPLQLLCRAFGVDDMSVQPELATASLQRKNAALIQERFDPILAEFSTEACLERLRETDILAAPVLDVEEAVAHEQSHLNGSVWEVDVPGHGRRKLAGTPVRLGRHDLKETRPPVGLGADSENVLDEIGYTADEINAFLGNGVIYQRDEKVNP